MTPIRVIAWSDDSAGGALGPDAARVHPEGVAAAIATALDAELGFDAAVVETGLHQPDDGVPDYLLTGADVLVWWGHDAHELVADETVDRVQRHVLDGLGLIVLHSGHHSKVFRRLMGTTCNLAWREGLDEELVWTIDPAHPIAADVNQPIALGPHEMYGEPFDVPAPDELVFVSAFSGGEVFRSGCCYQRGAGRVFYFSPGHETYAIYTHPQVRRVLANAVRWARPTRRIAPVSVAEAAPRRFW